MALSAQAAFLMAWYFREVT